ncbi:MAG: hypothetical protein IJT41_02885 [Clostridia bacterium]|nr:hypothetical protein [Clostridia bacterium]
MKKINHSTLIISIAAAVLIFGLSIAIGYKYGLIMGLIIGVSAFVVLITCLLIYNAKQNK